LYVPTTKKPNRSFDANDESTWPRVLGVAEVALILKLRPRKVQQLARGRRLPGAFRLDRYWRFKTDALKRWLRHDSAR